MVRARALVLTMAAACAACAPRSPGLSQRSGDGKTNPVEATLLHRVAAYSHDSTLGRAAGTPAHDKAAAYIAAEARRIGLQPANGVSFLQVVPLKRRSIGARSVIRVGDDSLVLWKEFAAFVGWLDARSFDGAQTVYAGKTTDSITQPASAFRGKVVLLAAPPGTSAVSARSYPSGHPFADAAAVVTTNVDALLPSFSRRTREPVVGVPPAVNEKQVAALLVSKRGAELMMGKPLAGLAPGTTGNVVRGALEYETLDVPSSNVVAVLRGTDAAVRDEYILVSAHSDHIGVAARAVDHDSAHAFRAAMRGIRVRNNGNLPDNEYAAIRVNTDSLRALRPPRRDSINNGADDDASGSMALLSIAEALTRNRPRRSVLFVWHTGEETGLAGSRWFTEHPLVPLRSIVAAVNLDMIGRGSASEEPAGGPDMLQVLGARRLSSELGETIENVNRRSRRPLDLRYEYDAPDHPEGLWCRSDHAMYARFGIPTLFLTTGMHGDYHFVTDEAQYLDYRKLARVVSFAAAVVREVANAPAPPTLDGKKSDPGAPCVQ